MWATTTVRPRGKASELSSDASQIKDWVSSVPDLDEMYTLKPAEELEKIVNDWLNGVDSSDEGTSRNVSATLSDLDSLTTNVAAPAPTSNTVEESTTAPKYRSLDDAFADLEDM